MMIMSNHPDAVRRSRWTPPTAAIVPNFHLPMRSYEVKNRISMGGLESAVSRLLRAFGSMDFLEADHSLVNLQLDGGADNEIIGGTTDEGELVCVPPAFISAKSYLLMHSNEVENRESIEKQVPSVIMKAEGIAPRSHPATIVYVPDTLDPIRYLNVPDLDSAYLLEPLLGGSVCYPVSIMRPNVKPEPPLDASAFDLDSANYFNEILPEPPLGVFDIYLKCRGTCYQDPICSRISFTRDTLIPSWCHDITRVVVLPRAAQIFWRPKSKFKIRTLYILLGKLIFFMIGLMQR